MLIELSPRLACYSTFSDLNSPLHLAEEEELLLSRYQTPPIISVCCLLYLPLECFPGSMPVVLEDQFNLSDGKYSDFIRNHHASVLEHCEFHAGMGVVGSTTCAEEWRWSVIHVTNDIGRSIEIVKSLESLWLYGYRRKVNNSNNHWRFITDEEEGFSGFPGERKSLNFDGKYPGYTSKLNVSRPALNSAITTLDNYAQELDNGAHNVDYNQAKKAFVMLILYFAEALRITPLRDVLIKGFDKFEETVSVGAEYMELAKSWSINSYAFLSGKNVRQDLWLALHKKGTRLDGIRPSELEDPQNGIPCQEPGSRNQLNLAIVGHVDSGKSTLCSRLLHLQGEAENKQKGLLAYAWAMDESSDEREREVTRMLSVKYFDSMNCHVVLLDSPGHSDFVLNFISGAAQADVAILVIDASIGACEAGMVGMTDTDQTKEHAQIIRSFGLKHLILAINKLDSVEYSKTMFDSIKLQFGPFLHSCGFKKSALKWIPLCAKENQNLIAPASDARLSSWYNGGCLLDAIDSIPPPSRDIFKPLILPICDIISSRTLGQLVVSGKLEAGAIGVDSKVIVMPEGTTGTARTLEKNGANCNEARAGDIVFVGLQYIEANQLTSGGTLCHVGFPVQVASTLELKILVLEIGTPILVGSQVEFYIHHAKASAQVENRISLIDKKTGEVLKEVPPRMLLGKQSAIIIVKLDREVCVEKYATCRALGRVFLRLSGSTIAVGIVNRIIE